LSVGLSPLSPYAQPLFLLSPLSGLVIIDDWRLN
jgi:hypothetical protein